MAKSKENWRAYRFDCNIFFWHKQGNGGCLNVKEKSQVTKALDKVTTRLFLCLPVLVSLIWSQTSPWFLKLIWTNMVLFRSTRQPFWNSRSKRPRSFWSANEPSPTSRFRNRRFVPSPGRVWVRNPAYFTLLLKSSLFNRLKMSEKEKNVFLAKLAEQAERYEGKEVVFDAISGHFGC